jgi:hypothetical protein
VRDHFGADELDVTETIAGARLQVLISREGEETDWIVPADIEVDVPDAPDGEPVRPVVVATARLAPTIAAGGRPLAPGDHDLRAVIWMAGFSAHALARRGEHPFGVTVTPSGRIYRRGSVPEPPPAPTPKQRARRAGGRLLRRMRGPRAAAAAR